jgi:hypothetical protein
MMPKVSTNCNEQPVNNYCSAERGAASLTPPGHPRLIGAMQVVRQRELADHGNAVRLFEPNPRLPPQL